MLERAKKNKQDALSKLLPNIGRINNNQADVGNKDSKVYCTSSKITAVKLKKEEDDNISTPVPDPPKTQATSSLAFKANDKPRRKFAAMAFVDSPKDSPGMLPKPPSNPDPADTKNKATPPYRHVGRVSQGKGEDEVIGELPLLGDLRKGRGLVKIGKATQLRIAAQSYYAASAENLDRTTRLLDLGSNVYIINDIKYFTNIHLYTLDIGTALYGNSMNVIGEGTAVILLPTVTGEVIDLELKESMFVLNASTNLISLSALDASSFEGYYGQGSLLIENSGELLWKLPYVNRLYVFPGDHGYPDILPGAKIATNIDFKDPV
ncbi:hypothetical protein LTR70_006650 [Exophiala xenobiotica]|uniref:Uncharacterized protein n=1 Tax=Lithohypha guttulata TaxID=1690604 RepID=A0ABR0KNV3_9EURO|nr:hypothetical protein LTR24_000352 [Lithohypha guttulata]KAK5315659.1 hypothetical protein LTR70_006650 [Exophiala xenobiotica]